ncbi:methionyl-tRNA formyltransferase [Paenimyroides ummariense]|uniref:Methionyl-tRNA formyltransferase n=1 Tax=Paenimyroides ummariense TaxID=913024 RepID=A0A1I5E413_9FLAO|nr:methionyl-tRNA formyltransferase [Paenimyroides ummariense]SFO05911.1 methionyl-tRNA formyltransferase [Paenimyroides ummariense]
MEKLRIVFMGTPDFAVGILDTILKNNYEVAAVVTAPDKPAGRGQKLNQSAVKVYAEENNLKVLQPTNLKSEDFLAELAALNANLQIVVAFRMLPKAVWQMPKLGTFNLHASLLPDYRGAAPINWAIINGEEKTGVSTFFIDEKIDTGAIILKNETDIVETETAGELHDRLMFLGAETVVETLKLIENNQVKTTIQPAEETKTAYKLNRENCKIDFNKSSKEVYNLIRGLNPYPSAYTILSDNGNEYNIKIHDVTYIIEEHDFKPGKFIASKKTIRIATNDGFIEILSLQFPGKKKMKTAELLNGMQFSDNASCN